MGCGLGGCGEERGDSGVGKGSHLRGGPHKAREVCLERPLIVITCAYLLACLFIHDVRGIVIWGEEGRGCIQQALSAFCPECGAIGIVVEDCCSVHVNSKTVRPLDAIDLATVFQVIGAIVDVVTAVDETNCRAPIPCFGSPIEVCRIACESSKASRELEECTIGNGVFVVVSIVKSEYLPFEAPSAAGKVPPCSLSIPEINGQLEPAWCARRWSSETTFSSRHGGKPPEALIIVPFVFLVCRHHIVILRPNLAYERPICVIIIRRVIRVVVIVEHSSPHSSCFPPIVWSGKDGDG